jgi:hypothetical protein
VRALVRVLSTVVALAAIPPAVAQPAPCAACSRGDQLIDQFSLQPLRSITGELAVPFGDPLTTDEYARIIELRRRTPALLRLGAVEEADLAAIAAALCQAPTGGCVETTTRALRCLADRCSAALPPTDPSRADVLRLGNCHRFSTRRRSPPIGVGFDAGTGWQRSRYPVDGRVSSLGLEARLRFGARYGLVGRVDHSYGRDVATDTNQDGNDDIWTGSVTRVSALAGGSVAFDSARFASTTRFLRLDLLGGYISTRSQPAESGPAAGADLSFQISIIRIGARFVQGFGEARDATMLLGHFGLLAGSGPLVGDPTDCGAETSSRSSRLALGFDTPLLGYGFSSELGFLAPGLGVEALWHLVPRLDAVVRADLLYFPGYKRERAIHQAVLAGVRIDHVIRKKTGWFSTIMGGYSHAAGLTPTTGSGPVGDVSLGWGIEDGEGAAYVRLHGRFGIGPDNTSYRAVFVSGGFELRFDPKRWREHP